MADINCLIEELKTDLEHWSICAEEHGVSFFVAGLLAFEMTYMNRALRLLDSRDAVIAERVITEQIQLAMHNAISD